MLYFGVDVCDVMCVLVLLCMDDVCVVFNVGEGF